MASDNRPLLLVEDDDSHAHLILMALRESGVVRSVDRVSDGEQALAYLRGREAVAPRVRPLVILLDLNLPKICGHEVLREIKGDDELKTIPTVILTTSSNEHDRRRAYQNHANSYLTKPIDAADFDRMIQDLGDYWVGWNQASP